jgi:pimeloyl-ACP methyl ester carboxylesterase
MDATGIKRPVLAGWSYGGRIMADYLRIYGPGKLAGLNYVDAGQKADPAFVGPNLKNLPLMASEDLAVRHRGDPRLPARLLFQAADAGGIRECSLST